MLAQVSMKSAVLDVRRWKRPPSVLSQPRDVLICLLIFGTICVDFVLVPFLNTVAPALASGLLAILLVRKRPYPSPSKLQNVTEVPSAWRIIIFLLLQAVFLVMARSWQGELRLASPDKTPIIWGVAKYLILLPAAVLMPLRNWSFFLREHRKECLAALIALITFYPYRTFHFAWPWYGQIMSQFVFWVSHFFVSGLQFLPAASPVLSGPALDVVVIPDCGGLQSIKLLQMLFVLLLVLDWDDLDKLRTLAAYWLGLPIVLLLNALRIALLVIAGNNWDPEFIVRHHIIVSSIFPAAFLSVFLWIGYSWLIANRGARSQRWDELRAAIAK